MYWFTIISVTSGISSSSQVKKQGAIFDLLITYIALIEDIQSNLYSTVTFGTKEKWPIKTGRPSCQFLSIVIRVLLLPEVYGSRWQDQYQLGMGIILSVVEVFPLKNFKMEYVSTYYSPCPTSQFKHQMNNEPTQS